MIARMRASLARLAHVGPALLSPIHSRSAQTQIDLAVIRAREVAVQTRTKIVNAVRGMVKSTGHRLPASPTLTFARKATEACPEVLQPALLPLIRLVQTLTDDIAAYDRLVVEKARAYPETQAIQTIHGVGALTAVAFVLVLNNDRSRFKRSRDVGCYLGLRPKQRDSGQRSPELGITKAGDPLLRRLATQSAQYILGPFGRDSALRRWGLSLASRGAKNAKKRAVVAVARKLVVLMHRRVHAHPAALHGSVCGRHARWQPSTLPWAQSPGPGFDPSLSACAVLTSRSRGGAHYAATRMPRMGS